MPIEENAPGNAKAPTGIAGFDAVTRGGLPRGRATLIEGNAGAGKTVFALQTLVNGVRAAGDPGIFVAFEEPRDRILANCSTFGWDVENLGEDSVYFLDANPGLDSLHAGDFDLGGMLAALTARAAAMGAKRIVFDALDVVFAFMPDQRSVMREMFRLNDWVAAHGLTTIITCKQSPAAWPSLEKGPEFMQFVVDCAIVLSQETDSGIAQRSLRVVKYRGSSYDDSVAPFVIGKSGFDVAHVRGFEDEDTAPAERIASGVDRLDSMLGGGYFRNATILVTGAPGTAKTTLAGSFAQAACLRGEPTLYMTFDSSGGEIVRNLASVGIQLEPAIQDGMLRIVPARAIRSSAETHLLTLKQHAADHEARCIVVDPVSALAKAGSPDVSHSVAERLSDWAKSSGMTLLCTSLLDPDMPGLESTPLEISTIADTWLHLSYHVQGGERNRGLSIIKSRGTSHSNQVRELILSNSGATLTDVYTAGGEVLMGTLRFEKEQAEQAQREEDEIRSRRAIEELDHEIRDLEQRLADMDRELNQKRAKQADHQRTADQRFADRAQSRQAIEERRGGGTNHDARQDR